MKLVICLLAVAARGEMSDSTSSVRLYLGNGCYWHEQHIFVETFEKDALKRKDTEVTAMTGYAGSTKVGPGGKVCYHNGEGIADYNELGHSEAVALEVPISSVGDLFSVYFKSFLELYPGLWTRVDPFDQGAEYRALVGFPGGMANDTMVEALKRANIHNMTLVAGTGSDPDTFNDNVVLVMDSNKFPFFQAELCMQFRNGVNEPFPDAYHNLNQTLQKEGRLHVTGCPTPNVCGSAANQLSAKSRGHFIV